MMPLPECKCQIEVDTVRKVGRYYPCGLHSAAPDLYQALEALTEPTDDMPASKIFAMARAALAKARGQSRDTKPMWTDGRGNFSTEETLTCDQQVPGDSDAK